MSCVQGPPGTLFSVLFLIGASGAFGQSRFAISSPAPGAQLRQTVLLSTNNLDIPSATTVEYTMNERLVAGPVRAPFQASWNSAWVWDGPGELHAVAKDQSGAIVAISPAVPVVVDNSVTQLRILSPAAGQVLSGTVKFEVETSRVNNALVPVDGTMFFVDGESAGTRYSAGPGAPVVSSVMIDTTKYTNGRHILFAGVHTTETGRPPVAMAQMTVQFQNGKSSSRLIPRWRELYLLPSEGENLDAQLLFTDGQYGPVPGAVTYSSSDSSIASVSGTGRVTALRTGIATITIVYQTWRAECRVIINSRRLFPHFANTGGLLTDYDPAKSFFPRSLFYLEPKMLDASATLARHTSGAAINALEAGFYPAKQDLNNPQSLADFRKSWDVQWNRLATSARAHGYKLVLTGDNLARFPSNLNDNLTWPWGSDAVKHVFTTLRDSGLAVALEMVDESSGMWGSTPFPSDGRWLKLNPPIPDNAFSRVMSWINSVPGRPPLSWPILWLSGPQVAANWMGDPRISDYASNYWDLNDWRAAYPWGQSLPQTQAGLDNVVIRRQPVLQRERPGLQLISINGSFYTKLGAGEEFVPGQDRQQQPPLRPETVAAQVMYAVAVGQAGIRAYGYDYDGWKNDRKNAPVGTGDRQTGAEPFRFGTDRWHAMASAFRLVSLLDPFIYYPQINAVNVGPSFVTGARQGAKGRMFVAVNFLDREVTATVNLAPYVYPGAAQQLVYTLQGARLGSEKRANVLSSTETFLPGEAKVWIFEPSIADPAVQVLQPLNGQLVSGGEPILTTSTDAITRSELWVDGVLVASQNGLQPFQAPAASGWPGAWRSIVVRAYNASGDWTEGRVGVVNQSGGTVLPPPIAPVATPPSVTITAPQTGVVYNAPATVTLAANATDTDGISKVEFYAGSTLVGTSTAAPYTAVWSNVAAGSYSVTARATDSTGLVGTSGSVSITVSTVSAPPPSVPSASGFVRGINLAGPAITIEGNPWLSGLEARNRNLLSVQSGAEWFTDRYSFTYSPAADAQTDLLLRSLLWASGTSPGGGVQLKLPVSNGTYQVYLWIVENNKNNYRLMDVVVEGVVVQSRVGELPLGAWRKLGPYTATVTDGVVDISMLNGGKGDPLVSGVALFSAATAPPPVAVPSASVSLTSPVAGTAYQAPATVQFQAAPSATNTTVTRVEYYQGSTLLGSSTAAPYSYAWTGVAAGTYSVTARVITAAGTTAASAPVTVTVAAVTNQPTAPLPAGSGFVRGVNLGGTTVTVDGNRFLGHTEAQSGGLLTLTNGQGWFTNAYSFPFTPAADTATAQLLRSVAWSPGTTAGRGMSISTPVANGTYQVYLWMIENNSAYYRRVDLVVEGVTVQTGAGYVPLGNWSKLGPFTAKVTDGKVDIQVLNGGRGDPTLSAFAIYTSSGQTTSGTDSEPLSPAPAPVPAPPSTAGFFRGINFGGEAVTVDGNIWMAQAAAQQGGLLTVTNGFPFSTSNYGWAFTPAADVPTSTVLNSVVWSPGTAPGQGITVSTPAPNGNYEVYLWTLENNADYYRKYDIVVQGQTVAAGSGEWPRSAWRKLGPFPAAVTDGQITVRALNAGKGDPLLAGIQINRN